MNIKKACGSKGSQAFSESFQVDRKVDQRLSAVVANRLANRAAGSYSLTTLAVRRSSVVATAVWVAAAAECVAAVAPLVGDILTVAPIGRSCSTCSEDRGENCCHHKNFHLFLLVLSSAKKDLTRNLSSRSLFFLACLSRIGPGRESGFHGEKYKVSHIHLLSACSAGQQRGCSLESRESRRGHDKHERVFEEGDLRHR